MGVAVGAPVPVVARMVKASDSARMPAVLSTLMKRILTPVPAGKFPWTTYSLSLVVTKKECQIEIKKDRDRHLIVEGS